MGALFPADFPVFSVFQRLPGQAFGAPGEDGLQFDVQHCALFVTEQLGDQEVFFLVARMGCRPFDSSSLAGLMRFIAGARSSVAPLPGHSTRHLPPDRTGTSRRRRTSPGRRRPAHRTHGCWRACVEPAMRQAERRRGHGAVQQFGKGAVQVFDHRFLGQVQMGLAPGAGGVQHPGVEGGVAPRLAAVARQPVEGLSCTKQPSIGVSRGLSNARAMAQVGSIFTPAAALASLARRPAGRWLGAPAWQ